MERSTDHQKPVILDTAKSLLECHRLLKPNKFLVIVEAIALMNRDPGAFSQQGFQLAGSLLWKPSCWWTDYYGPLEERIRHLRKTHTDSEKLAGLRRYEAEVAMVKRNPAKFDCAHYVLKKVG